MTDEEYKHALSDKEKELQKLRAEAKSISISIIGENLFVKDLYFCSTINRCINLIDGLVPMLQDRNLTCAGVLLRMQMDNCMRSYAAFIAKDRTALFNGVMDGKKINNLKDINGKQLSDRHLKEELTKFDPRFANVYDQASGYVHFSEKAFYQTIVNCKDDVIEFQIGLKLPEKYNPYLIEAADAFIHFVELHFRILEAVAESKRHYDSVNSIETESRAASH